MLTKIVTFLVLIIIAYWLVRRMLRNMRASFYASPSENPQTLETRGNIVRCVHCGLHIPEKEAIMVRGKIFCCEGHRVENEAQR